MVNYQYDAANRLTSVNGQPYNWDDNGNLLSGGLRTYTYDHANRLTQVVSGTLTTQFLYNGAGDRVAKTVDGVTTDYVLDPAAGLTQVLQEATDGQATSYLYGHDLLAQYDCGTWTYHVNDGLGSVRQLADPAGQVVQGYSFSPFGVPLGESGGEPYGYTGEQWDASAGLVFLRARYMQPATGRFVSKDPWPGDIWRPGTFNEFVYVLDNPANQTDPSGLLSGEPIHAMIQTKFMATHGLSYPYGVIPEFYIPGGSKQGLTLVTAGQFGQPGFTAQLGGTPTGHGGFADIVGLATPATGDIYEIKYQRDLLWGIAEIAWYIQANNANPGQPKLVPGVMYTWSPEEELIGTNPYYSGQEIVANMQAPGVITYRARRKSQRQPSPQPVYVWEYDRERRKVVKRQLVPVYYYAACPSPEIAEIAQKAAGDTVKIGGVTFVVWWVIQVGQGLIGFLLAGPPGAAAGAAVPP